MAGCSFWLKKKQRICGFPRVSDTQFCSQHVSDTDFIPCPLDPRHKVNVHKLDKHLVICNKTKARIMTESLPYYSHQLTVLRPYIPDQTISFKTWSGNQTNLLIERLNRVYAEAEVVYRAKTGRILPPVNVPRAPHPDRRQHIQSQVLARHIEDEHLLDPGLCYLEYGAGKGALSHYISERTQGQSEHYLIERAPIRNKFDRTHKGQFTRLQVDIADLNLDALEIIHPVVGVGKHVCGGATDLSLVSLFQSGLQVRGLVLATCCHHRCSLSTYVNLTYLYSLGLCDSDILELFKATSWGPSGAVRPEDADEVSCLKSEAGLKAKRIVDIGRVLFLAGLMSSARLEQYCDNSLTPENMTLIASNAGEAKVKSPGS